MNIKKIIILRRPTHADHLTFVTDLPQSTFAYNSGQCFRVTGEATDGAAYCQDNFPGIPVEIIDLH